MNISKHLVTTAISFFTIAAIAQQKDMASCPMMQSDQHSHGVDARGDMAMGFSHEKTKHHFRLFKDGGSIDVVVKSSSNTDQVKAIRAHLQMIRGMFASGDFHLPMFIHDQVVPGQKTMVALKKQIAYSYSDLPKGARVRMRTSNPKVLGAIHKFLAFQVKDHRTGDSGKVEKP